MVFPIGVWPAASADLDAVMRLLHGAQDRQRARGLPVWSDFDPAGIAADISRGDVYLAKTHGRPQATVTLVESDETSIWRADEGRALYLHRLASDAPGAGALLIRWARCLAGWRCKNRVRLETWQENRALRDYYERQGFRHVRDQYFAPDSPLPADYRGTVKTLYQIEL
jgi:hypothetical protein